MLLPILVLLASIFFVFGFSNHKVFNFTRKILLHVKIPFSTSPAPPLNPSSTPKNNTISCVNKKDDDLKRVFDTFDKNRDGFITMQELKESLNGIGIFESFEEVEEMMCSLDCNKDGLVDLGEFKELYEIVKGKEEEEVIDEEEEELKDAFDVFDEDKDGFITVKELGFVLTSLGMKECVKEDECMEMIKMVDVDGDGKVNFDEFKCMMRSGGATSRLVSAF